MWERFCGHQETAPTYASAQPVGGANRRPSAAGGVGNASAATRSAPMSRDSAQPVERESPPSAALAVGNGILAATKTAPTWPRTARSRVERNATECGWRCWNDFRPCDSAQPVERGIATECGLAVGNDSSATGGMPDVGLLRQCAASGARIATECGWRGKTEGRFAATPGRWSGRGRIGARRGARRLDFRARTATPSWFL